MASGVSIEILDLRHFTSPMLRPVLEAEGELWKQRLHWDYRASVKLLMQYLDSHMLPGYAAVEEGQITGYAFCVYEETKAVIGDAFASGPGAARGPCARGTLLRHLFELLDNSPQVDRLNRNCSAPIGHACRGLQRCRIQGLPQSLHGAAALRVLGTRRMSIAGGSRIPPLAGRRSSQAAAHHRGLSRSS